MGPSTEPSQPARCPSCAAAVESDWLTCRSCGTVLAAVRRRSAAVAGPATGDPATTQPAIAHPGTTPPAIVQVPSSPPVHTAAIPLEPPPPASRELGPNQWYSARGGASPPVAGPEAGAVPAADGPMATPGLFADLPLDIPAGGGRIAVVGLVAIAIAFLLPWSPLPPGFSYFDAWGFGRASRIPVFVADLVLLLLAVAPIGLDRRLRTGWLPFAFGVFVIGVFWERVDSLRVVGPGAWLFAIGGILALVGGLLTLIGRGPGDGAIERPQGR